MNVHNLIVCDSKVIFDILIEIKDKISEDQLVKLASIVIEKVVTIDIRRLLVEIKDKITLTTSFPSHIKAGLGIRTRFSPSPFSCGT